jgi:Family of unknown function (DUF5906)
MTTAATPTRFEITYIRKDGGPLTKRACLVADADGALTLKISSNCRMVSGTAQRVACELESFAELVGTCSSDAALTLGRLKAGLPPLCKVILKRKRAKMPKELRDVIDRSDDYIEFAAGPGPCLLDLDAKGMPAALADLDAQAALGAVIPNADKLPAAFRNSTSHGIKNAETGEKYEGSRGSHTYLLIKDQRDSDRFLKALRDKHWLAGMGWIVIAKNGAMLVRAPFDVSVGSAPRFVFEGKLIADSPLVQADRPATVVNPDAEPFDTSTIKLTRAEQKQVKALVAQAKAAKSDEAERVRAEYGRPHLKALIAAGVDEKTARKIVDRLTYDNILPDTFVLEFDTLGNVTVSEVRADPDKYVGETLSDPHEGPAYGTGKAIVYQREDGSFLINSQAHGGVKYTLLTDEEAAAGRDLKIDNFRFYMKKDNAVIHTPSGAIWPGANLDRVLPWIEIGKDEDGEPKMMRPTTWLAKNSRVNDMTWSPADPKIINDALFEEAGRKTEVGARVFNRYSPPGLAADGDPAKAGPWIDHARRIYPDDAEHIFDCLAHRVQRPGEKLNHALVLGGKQGVGKDSLLEPAKRAVGSWNCQSVTPEDIVAPFTGWQKSVLLIINEARDQSNEHDRYRFADHMKNIICAPPDMLRVNEKNIPQYYIPNVCFVVYTNHKHDALYVTEDDRRHYFTWSEARKEDFEPDYFVNLWSFFENENGYAHVAAFLAKRDISKFNPKAPPALTDAFHYALATSRPTELGEFADELEAMGDPPAITIRSVLAQAIEKEGRDFSGNPKPGTFAHWLSDRKNRRAIPHRMETCGYAEVKYKGRKDGLWKIGGKAQAVYVSENLSKEARQLAAERLAHVESTLTPKPTRGPLRNSPAEPPRPQSRNRPPRMTTSCICTGRSNRRHHHRHRHRNRRRPGPGRPSTTRT